MAIVGAVSNLGVGQGLAVGVDPDGTDQPAIAMLGQYWSDETATTWLIGPEELGGGTIDPESTHAFSFSGTSATYYTRPADLVTGDADGDGHDDLLVVWCAWDYACLVHGPLVGDWTLDDADLAGIASDYLEWMPSGGGAIADLDGDGYVDIGVGDELTVTFTIGWGPVEGDALPFDDQTVLTSEHVGSMFGQRAEVLGDIDGDGIDELAVVGDDLGYGGLPGTYVLADVPRVPEVDPAEAGLRLSELLYVHAVGDLDGDGRDDVVAGSTRSVSHEGGSVHVYLSPLPETGVLKGSDADAIVEGAEEGSYVGMGWAPLGDVDRDGHADLLVGAAELEGGPGSAYLLRGPFEGTRTTDDATVRLVGATDDSRAGWAVGADDFNGDGEVDLAIAAPYDATGANRGGAVYVLFGPVP